jgi:YD repeat-containing protein
LTAVLDNCRHAQICASRAFPCCTNHLIKVYVSASNKTVKYKYDVMGRRVAKRVNDAGYGWSDWPWCFYDGLKVIAEGAGTNDKAFMTLGPGAIGGVILSMKNEKRTMKSRRTTDDKTVRLGTPVCVTDANGDVGVFLGTCMTHT